MADWIKVVGLGPGEAFEGYCAEPEGSGRPGVVVLQEIFGVNAGIQAMTRRWAENAYLALAPDLFWRHGPRIMLDADVEPEFKRALGLMGEAKVDDAVRDIEAAIRTLRAHPKCNGKVAVIGYCWGGLLAYLSATRTDVDASVGYYGVGIERYLGEAHAIANPLLLHIAEEDAFVPAEAQAAVRGALEANRHVTIHGYAAGHAFARESGSHRGDAMAELADGRTAAFLAERLGG